MMHECRQCATPIRYICCRHGNCVRQSLGIDRNMALNSRHLFASVISFTLSRVGIFYALCINDAKRRLFVAAKADADHANHIFLMPAPAGLIRLPPTWHSNGRNMNTRYSNSDTRSVAFATGIRFSIRTVLRKIPRIDRFAVASSSSVRFPEWPGPFQIVRDSRRLGILFASSQFTHLFADLQKDRKQVLILQW